MGNLVSRIGRYRLGGYMYHFLWLHKYDHLLGGLEVFFVSYIFYNLVGT